MNTGFLGPAVATVLTVYGIETYLCKVIPKCRCLLVATVLTVYGIETFSGCGNELLIIAELQQYLPFTVLKLS